MKNIGQIMKQAQQMQTKMAELQEQLAALEVSGSAGGGMVQGTMSGNGERRGVKIEIIVGGRSPTEPLQAINLGKEDWEESLPA